MKVSRFPFLFSMASALALSLAAPVLWASPYGWGEPSLTLDLADLSPEPGTFTRVAGAAGPTTFGNLGTPVAGGFDVDGDGFTDIAVGHMTTTTGPDRPFAGEVQLVFGNGTLGETVDLAIAQPRVLRILGGGAFEATGSEVWMGDVTGDGLGDLLICRQGYSPGGLIDKGALTLIPGTVELRNLAATTGVLDLRDPPANLDVLTFVGPAAGARLGIWARTGDVDGDGIDELVVSADGESIPGEDLRGAVYVVRGGSHLAQSGTIDLVDFGSTTLAGLIAKITPPPGSADFHLGATLQTGDLDRDGRAEIFLGATINRAGAILSGSGMFNGPASGGAPGGLMYIVWDESFPHGNWPAGLTIDLGSPPPSLTTIHGGVQNQNFGEELLGGKDYDGDGRPDLFIGDLTGDGTYAQDRPTSGVGYVLFRARYLKGRTTNIDRLRRYAPMTKILGPVPGAIGADTVTDGDFNGDGIDDLVFGNPHDTPHGRKNAGTFHVIFGQGRRGHHGYHFPRSRRWPRLIDTADGELPPRFRVRITEVQGALAEIPNPDGGFFPLDAGDTLCYSAAAGDIDGDGLTDVITNEMIGNGVAPDAVDVGNMVIFSGAFLTP